jgi:hypothetical protein
VLPDEASGQGPVTRDSETRNLSRRAPAQRSEVGGARRVRRGFYRPGTHFMSYTSVAPRPEEVKRKRGYKVFGVQVTSQDTQTLIAGTGAIAV